MPAIVINKLTKRYGKVTAVDNIDLTVPDGSFVTLLGPSGCGKTTTIKCIAGLEKPDAGEIRIGGKVVSSSKESVFVPTEKRKLGMVFQSYAVWPHMTVARNVEYPLVAQHFPRNQRSEKVQRALELVRLEGLGNRYPGELSGGQQQRVALARALVYEPEVLLLDEPLSNLDAKLRESMRLEIRELQRKLGITTVYVTHDQLEALVMSDIVCLVNKGSIVQMGAAMELYRKPASKFSAGFIGTTSFLDGEITEEMGTAHDLRTYRSKVGNHVLVCCSPADFRKGDLVFISIRPECVRFSDEKQNGPNFFVSKVKTKTYLGDRIKYLVEFAGTRIGALTGPSVDLSVGQEVCIEIKTSDCLAISKSAT
jgi:iron(III) transport system ATP-binding protein